MTKYLTLRQMEYLVALAEEGSHTSAAKRTHVSQPTLTESIRDAERSLGVLLFEKSGGVTRPTVSGESVVEAARNALDAALRVSNAAKWSDVLRIGAIDTVAPYLLPGSLKTLRKSEASLKIAPTSGRTDSLVAKLREGSIDAVVLASPAPDDCQTYVLGRDEFKLLTSSSLTGRVSMSYLKESNIDVILLEDGHCLRTQAVNACKVATGGLAGGVIDGGSLDMVVEMVASGLGATLVPQIAVQSLLNRKDLRVSDMTPEEQAGRDLIVAWRPGHRREQEIVRVSKALGVQFRKLAKS